MALFFTIIELSSEMGDLFIISSIIRFSFFAFRFPVMDLVLAGIEFDLELVALSLSVHLGFSAVCNLSSQLLYFLLKVAYLFMLGMEIFFALLKLSFQVVAS